MVTAALLAQLALSLGDINEAVQRTERVGSQVREDHSDPGNVIMKVRRAGRKLSVLQYADILLRNSGEQECAAPMSRIQVVISNEKHRGHSNGTGLRFDSRASLKKLVSFGTPRIYLPSPGSHQSEPRRYSRFMSATSRNYVLEVRRLLYLTEFLVLIYYVGVFIPLIFCKYLFINYIF